MVVAFCHVSNEEAAAGRSFTLAQPFPGEPLLAALPALFCCLPARLVGEAGLVCHEAGHDVTL